MAQHSLLVADGGVYRLGPQASKKYRLCALKVPHRSCNGTFSDPSPSATLLMAADRAPAWERTARSTGTKPQAHLQPLSLRGF